MSRLAGAQLDVPRFETGIASLVLSWAWHCSAPACSYFVSFLSCTYFSSTLFILTCGTISGSTKSISKINIIIIRYLYPIVLSGYTIKGIFFLVLFHQYKTNTSWGWAVPSSGKTLLSKTMTTMHYGCLSCPWFAIVDVPQCII